ncbi:MAG: DUF4433 domain-containing protein [Defluviitaleaceae bacterium]|nr:DUF4433 domain-containing protein [Defluviitaleaceae bacterium]
MGIESARTGKFLYHLTRLSNLTSIVSDGLLPRKTLLDNRVNFGDVADRVIISERVQLGLDIYTPFHFHPYSAFDVAVKNTYARCKFIYICIQRDFARNNNFKILAKHPLSIDECELHDYDYGFEQIDWDTLMEKGRVDNYAKQVKMAECLTDLPIPAQYFTQIAVKDEEVQEEVEEILSRAGLSHPPYVNTQPWF